MCLPTDVETIRLPNVVSFFQMFTNVCSTVQLTDVIITRIIHEQKSTPLSVQYLPIVADLIIAHLHRLF